MSDNTIKGTSELEEAIEDVLENSDNDALIAELYSEFADQTRMVRSTRQLLTTLAQRRRETTVKLRESGQSYRVIAERTGLSKSAIQQILGKP